MLCTCVWLRLIVASRLLTRMHAARGSVIADSTLGSGICAKTDVAAKGLFLQSAEPNGYLAPTMAGDVAWRRSAGLNIIKNSKQEE